MTYDTVQRREYHLKNKEKENSYSKKYYWDNTEREKSQSIKRYKDLYEGVLNHYGHQCPICGSMEKLGVDHIGGWNGNGKYLDGHQLWFWLKKNNYPKEFRILCRKCNLLDGYLRKHKRLGINGIDALIKLKNKEDFSLEEEIKVKKE
jgi:hypothetical protein